MPTVACSISASMSAAALGCLASRGERRSQGIDRLQGLPAAGDHQAFRHREIEIPVPLSGALEVAHQIRENAKDAVGGRVELLVILRRDQKGSRRRRHLRPRRNCLAGTIVGEIEMQPQPAAAVGLDIRTFIARQLPRTAVALDA